MEYAEVTIGMVKNDLFKFLKHSYLDLVDIKEVINDFENYWYGEVKRPDYEESDTKIIYTQEI